MLFLKWMIFLLDFFDITKRGGYSRRSLFGGVKHYNKHGRQIGYSIKSFGGGYKRYDMNGKLVSITLKGLFGDYKTYNASGKQVRTSRKNALGGYTTYDNRGHKVSESYSNSIGEMSHMDNDEYSYDVPIKRARNEHKQITTTKNTIKETNRDTKPETRPKRTQQYTTSNNIIKVEVEKINPYKTYDTEGELLKKHDADAIESYSKDVEVEDVSVNENKSLEYYSSIQEYLDDKNIDNYIRLLVHEYKGMKEFPAIAYTDQDIIKFQPLVYGEEPREVKINEVKEAKRICVTDLDMDIMDREFLSLVLSDIGKEFEDLLPDYSMDMSGMSRIQYVFECGLVITENSMDELKLHIQ